ncbi:unnamed protein product [Withania somnifera]
MRGISDNVHDVILAISSSIFIGASFIIKKKGLKKASATGGTRAGSGGHGYLLEPIGGLGLIVGEGANFAAYAYAPAILVTPRGALSIIVSAVLAHFILKERLPLFGIVGCMLCLVGSISIILHAPLERKIESVMEVWYLATEPVVVLVIVLIFRFVPSYGQRYMVIYIRICSLTVMGVKAVGIALKLTFEGKNQFGYFQTWLFTVFVICFCLLQLNYLNKALDTFNTAVVSPVYYVMFTTLTILASMIMFKDWDHQTATQIINRTLWLCNCSLWYFSPSQNQGYGK